MSEQVKVEGVGITMQDVPPHMARSFMTIIGEVDLLNAERCVYKKVINQVKYKFCNGRDALKIETETDRVIPSDVENLLQFKPTEALADMVTQLLGYLCLGEIEAAKEELMYLTLMRESPHLIIWHPDLDEVFNFCIRIFEAFINWTTAKKAGISIDEELPNVQELSPQIHVVLKVVRSYVLGNFRHKISQRMDILQQAVADEENMKVEWLLVLAELTRRKRRDCPKHLRGKRGGGGEEHKYVDKALELDHQNPFVKLALLDCIVDCLRDSRLSFTCGGMTFSTNNNNTMAFMKESCRDILKEFPRSVKLHSQISDYFARFVTLCFFDVPYAEECLELAYKLNPMYPPTTHRLGIFNRMSKGALSASFAWFKKTANLDPYHYNAFMECVKNMIGLPGEYNAAAIIEEKIWTPGGCSWTDGEILELLFYKGIAHFVRKEMEEALKSWIVVSEYYQPLFRLCDLDQTCGFYNWDEEIISSDKLRVWMHQEKLREDQPEKRRKLVTRLYELMIGTIEPAKPILTSHSLSCSSIFRYYQSQDQL